jgi:RNA polymerase sigma-70 factor, ECF subfamily
MLSYAALLTMIQIACATIDGLYSYAMVLTGSHAETEQLVQGTYARGLRAAGWLPAGTNTKMWLFTILRHIWLNEVRKRQSRPHFFGIENCDGRPDGLAQPMKDAQDIYMTKTEATRIQAAIQKLPLEFREVILLREYGELSYQEIARVLNCPAGTVRSCLVRARAKLYTVLFETPEKSERP